MALDDYFSDPSQDCLARLFDAINSMDLTVAPSLTRHEKLVMRHADRKDIFSEKFSPTQPPRSSGLPVSESSETVAVVAIPVLQGVSDVEGVGLQPGRPGHRQTNSWDSRTSVDEGIIMRAKDSRERSGTDSTVQSQSLSVQSHKQLSPSESSFGPDASTVWVGNEPGLENAAPSSVNANGPGPGLIRSKTVSTRGRSSTDASSSSGHGNRRDDYFGGSIPTLGSASNLVKDTHSFHTVVGYKGHHLPIKMPLSTFSEEVGDVSNI
jgi:hypothetical protein